MNKLLAALAVSVLMTGTAFAGSCPTHMAKIDEALAANPSLSAEDLAKVQELRAQGETLHDEGKHAESEAALAEAEGLLGIGM